MPADPNAYPSFSHLPVELQDEIIMRTRHSYRMLTVDRHFFQCISANEAKLDKRLWYSIKINKTIALSYTDNGELSPHLHVFEFFLTPMEKEYALGRVRFVSAHSLDENKIKALFRHVAVSTVYLYY